MPCLNPISLKIKDAYNVAKKTLVPCGYCIKCRKKYRRDWIFRLQQEAKDHNFINMITLTYNSDNVPIQPAFINTDTGEYGEATMTLRPQDLTLFMKRLRRKQEYYIQREYDIPRKLQTKKHKIRYYACGEYGSKTKRPHYHLIVFNMHPYIKDRLNEVWKHGFTHTGNIFTDAAISYATKYLLKGKREKANYGNKHPEFIRMSRSPAIGARYLKNADFNIKEGKHEWATLLVKNNSNKFQLMPRYYRDKLLPQGKYLDKAINKLLEQSVKDYNNEVEKIEKTGQNYDLYKFDQLKAEIKQLKNQYKSNL